MQWLRTKNITIAIAEHHSQTKEIQDLKSRLHNSQLENESLRRENNVIRLENSQLRSEVNQGGSNNHQSVMNGFTPIPQNGGQHVNMNAYQQFCPIWVCFDGFNGVTKWWWLKTEGIAEPSQSYPIGRGVAIAY